MMSVGGIGQIQRQAITSDDDLWELMQVHRMALQSPR